MASISVFGIGVQSRSRAVTPAKLTNLYVEQRPEGETDRIVAYGTPGLDLFANFGDTAIRGMIPVEPVDLFFPVHRGTFYEVNNAAQITSRGTLNSTQGRVDQAHNGTVVMTVDGTDGYTYNTSSNAFAEITDGDFIAGAKTCTWLDQYFIVENGDVFQISDNGTDWAAADIGVPESNPDGIVKVIANHGELTIFNELTTEFWVNTGATDFPFAPLKSSTAQFGCAAPWSVCYFNDTVAFLAKNQMGQSSVMILQGYVPVPISTPDIDDIINSYADVGDASAFSYMLGGHPMYQINFPAAGYSWMYDGLSQRWYSRKSYGINRQRNEIGIQYINKTLLSDYANGKLYRLAPTTYTENGDPIESIMQTDNVKHPDGIRFSVDRFRLEMQTGGALATGQGVNPQAMLQVSRDNGYQFGAEQWRSFGTLGQYAKRVQWNRQGAGQVFAFKVAITDPVKRVITDAVINPPD